MSNQAKFVKKKDVYGVQFDHFNETGRLAHAYSSKMGGVSEGVFESMNLGHERGDRPEHVVMNYKRFLEGFEMDETKLVLTQQVHKNHVALVGATDSHPIKWWMDEDRPSRLLGVDGLITNDKGVVLTTFYADCVPLFFYDPVNEAIGLSHAGWRGTVAKIGPMTIAKMKETWGTKPQDLLVGIGPSIGPCCYEVGESVKNEFENIMNHDIIGQIAKKGRLSQEGQHYMLDLWEANRLLLLEAGCQLDHIIVSQHCTLCEKERFFSHRHQGVNRGSAAAFLALRT